MTEKLFYADSTLRQFSAQVLRCDPVKGGFAVLLDRTAFYPEGGGQPADRGTLGGVSVTDVREKDGEILHLTDRPLEPGQTAEGRIDHARRQDLTEQHSGEHMLSGLICRHFHCDNVGFHISDDFVTIDFNAQISREELLPIEEEANALIRADVPVHIFFPSPEELEKLSYRSKKALTGAVRIVEFPGADICACCGTHVARTGEIGLVKIVSCENHRGGVRLEILSGRRALAYFRAVLEENRRISALLSAKPLETAAAAERLLKEDRSKQERLAALETAAAAKRAAELAGTGDVLLTEQGMSPDAARRLMSAVAETCGGFCGVLSVSGEELRYVLSDPRGGLRELARGMNAAFSGRGGGSDSFVQGSLKACPEEISAFLGRTYPQLKTE